MFMQSQEILGYSPTTLIAKQRFSSLFLTHTHTTPAREVVIKVFDALLLETAQEQQRFLDDTERIQALNHPRILPFFSLGIDHNQPYLISPYLPKGSLRFHLNQARFSWEKTLKLLQQIGEVLNHAHANHLVHANLKPENIFLTPMDDVLLMDFRLPSLYSKMQERGYHPDARTSAYMAPEAFNGQEGPKSDQYALACLAFELITGSAPFQALAFITSVNKHGQKTLPSLKTFVPNVPEHIDSAIRKALDKQPDNRHENIDAFLYALGEPQKAQQVTEFRADDLLSSSEIAGKGQHFSLQLLSSLEKARPMLYRKDRSTRARGQTAFVRLLEDQDMRTSDRVLPALPMRVRSELGSGAKGMMPGSAPQEPDAPLVAMAGTTAGQPPLIEMSPAGLPLSKQSKRGFLWVSAVILLFLLIIPLLVLSFQVNKAIVENRLLPGTPTNLTVPPQQGTPVLQNPLTTLHSAPMTSTALATQQATTVPHPRVTPTPSPVATTPPLLPASMVYVHYQLNAHWFGGFSTTLTITNNSATTINGWTLQFTFPGDEQITQLWSGHYTQTGQTVTITNVDYDATIAPGHTVTLGFNGRWRESYASPTTFLFNGAMVN
jgi:serine/threonine protein kinase